VTRNVLTIANQFAAANPALAAQVNGTTDPTIINLLKSIRAGAHHGASPRPRLRVTAPRGATVQSEGRGHEVDHGSHRRRPP